MIAHGGGLTHRRPGAIVDPPELTRTSDANLLLTYAALTHRMHDLPLVEQRGLRAQRDAVRDEVLRRMGGAR